MSGYSNSKHFITENKYTNNTQELSSSLPRNSPDPSSSIIVIQDSPVNTPNKKDRYHFTKDSNEFPKSPPIKN
ncbi:hypothetical protein BB560_006200, partial [Smittium megazygosporum]